MATPEEQQAINDAAARARGGPTVQDQQYSNAARELRERGAVRFEPMPWTPPGTDTEMRVRRHGFPGPQEPDPALVSNIAGRIDALNGRPKPQVPTSPVVPPLQGDGDFAPQPNSAAKGAPASASTQVTQQDTINFTPYASQNPTSMYDKDIEFTHTLSRMLGMAGLGDKAAGARDLHMKLQMGRMDEIGEQAQRAFIAGDITKGIDMFNHAVPNGQKIVGYHKAPDGKTFAFKMEDGTELRKTGEELAYSLTMFRKPETLAAMMTQRAKSLADLNKDMAVAGYKGQLSIQEAVVKGLITQAGQIGLEQLKQAGEKPTVFQQVGGKVFVTTAGGKVFEQVTVKGKDGKMQEVWQPSQLPGMPSSGSPGAGYGLDMARIYAALGQQPPQQ
jgi:hypothetical protein